MQTFKKIIGMAGIPPQTRLQSLPFIERILTKRLKLTIRQGFANNCEKKNHYSKAIPPPNSIRWVVHHPAQQSRE
jgi:hypothetical protein